MPKNTAISPLVNGTVESHKIPSSAENINAVKGFCGSIMNKRNNTDLNEYRWVNKYFFYCLSPKYPLPSVPTILNSPISAKAQPPTHVGMEASERYAGR